MLNPLNDQNIEWNYWIKQFQFEDISLAYSVSGNLSILLNHEIGNLLFSKEEYTNNNTGDSSYTKTSSQAMASPKQKET